MQDIISHIFETLGGATVIATGTGIPVQTVHDWIKKGKAEIPPWRRAAVLDFARREKKLPELSDAAREYLSSAERFGKAAA